MGGEDDHSLRFSLTLIRVTQGLYETNDPYVKPLNNLFDIQLDLNVVAVVSHSVWMILMPK